MRTLEEIDREVFGAGKEVGEQGSIDWLYERVGKATGSEFVNIMATRKDKKEAAPRYNYRMELVVERLTRQPAERYVSKYMEWGTEHEDAACMAYEKRTKSILLKSGFVHHPTIAMCGGSPDGLVDDDGIIEVKCPTTFVHIETLLGGMPVEHTAQTQGYLWITGRKWCDFVSFDPRLPEPLQLYVQRFQRDDAYIAMLEAEVIVFLREVEALMEQLTARSGPGTPAGVPLPTDAAAGLSR